MQRRSNARGETWPWAIACLGVIARLVLIALRRGSTSFYDERDYDALARSLAEGHGYVLHGGPSAFRPPGWPIALAAVYKLFGEHPIAGQIAQALLLGFATIAVSRLARLVSGRRSVAIWATVAAALHPALAYASATLYPTALTAAALTIGIERVASALYARRDRALAPGAIGACFLGLAGVATTYFAPLPVVVAAIAMRRRKFALAMVVASIGVAPTALWVARNAVVFGAPVLSTSVGFNLAIGADDEATPRSGNWVERTLADGEAGGDELSRDRAWRARAHRWIAAHPTRYAALAVGRALAALDSVGIPKTRGAHDGRAAQVVAMAMVPWTLLALVGGWLARRRVAAQITLAALLLVAASSAVSIAKPRFRFPVDPALGVLSAVALVRVASRLRARIGSRPVTSPASSPVIALQQEVSACPR